ncbi:MAG TPA: 3-phosphoserine/phosphohydroxythreonine transaminase [Rectinemataceae bacterium]|nr:3-phosphoserine/phosphohydroxythreonine transaminase [Rectinemataceae bacterium]
MKRVINFNAGPAAIPLPVLEKAQAEMLDWKGTGMSVMEVSHRSKEYEEMHNHAQALFREIAGMGPEWKILFLTGGASTQFFQLPMNMLYDGKTADYIVTGHWGKAAVKEAKHFGQINVTTTEQDGAFRSIPKQAELKLDPKAAYVHYTSNNTIFGSQWHYWPKLGPAPVVCDMSSDIFSRPFPASEFSMIYAGAQKNLGPSGVTLVAIKEDFLAKAKAELPTMLAYKTFADNNSLYNTPPCFSIYILDLTLGWIKDQGGLVAMEKTNQEKGRILYGAIDASGGYYACPVEKESRSLMNVVFRLKSEELEEKFVKEAKAAGIIGVKGHRSTGGIRFSTYNASSVQNIKDASAFMQEFQKKNG